PVFLPGKRAGHGRPPAASNRTNGSGSPDNETPACVARLANVAIRRESASFLRERLYAREPAGAGTTCGGRSAGPGRGIVLATFLFNASAKFSSLDSRDFVNSSSSVEQFPSARALARAG